MEKRKLKIVESRERFDRTLASPDLTREESIKLLVENQILRTIFSGSQEELGNVVEKRALEVSNFLEMLRSASGDDKASLKSHGSSHIDWKLKQDTDELRVMYREGPEGTPFHTLLAEGYADGPVDACLCVSWESTLYKTWWPQYSFPTFKIVSSSSLQKVRIGEEISLVRMKVPWPVFEREAILHNFELEFFQEDLILVLLNTISTTEHIEMGTHGFTIDGIPEAKGTVRVDLVGGFALQKVSPTRSYFRVIANLDIKLDFVPPSLINFISRQLIGNGHKLYQKALASVLAGDKEYQEALKGVMYSRIRQSLYSSSKPKVISENVQNGKLTSLFTEEIVTKTSQLNGVASKEIEEEYEDCRAYSIGKQHMNNMMAGSQHSGEKDRAIISPEVKHALDVLDQAMAILHDLQPSESSTNILMASRESGTSYTVEEIPNSMERHPEEKRKGYIPSSDTEGSPVTEHLRHGRMEVESVDARTASNGKESNSQITIITEDGKRSPSTKQPSVLDHVSRVFDEVSITSKGAHNAGYTNRDSVKQKKKKKRRNCCISFL